MHFYHRARSGCFDINCNFRMSAVLYFNSLSSLARAAWSLPLSNIEILIVDTLTMYMGLQRYTVVAAVTDTPCCKYT